MQNHLSSAPLLLTPSLPSSPSSMVAGRTSRVSGKVPLAGLPSKQMGMGFWGYIMVLVLVAVVITLALRLGPHYMNHRTVATIIEGLGTNTVHQMEKRQIKELLKKRFKINTLYDLDASKIVEIERTKEDTKLKVNYEVREPMVYNIDAILVFNDEFEFR